jgi:hypothetical protein
MPIELSRSREGENQRSDQTRRDASSNNGRIRDFATHQYQLHGQQQREAEQRKGKSMMTPEMEAQYSQENIQQVIKQRGGKTSPGSEIQLGNQKGLDGGIDVNATIATIKIHIQNMQKYHKEGTSSSDNYDKSNEHAKKYVNKLKDGYSGQINKIILQREHEYTGDQASLFMGLYNES